MRKTYFVKKESWIFNLTAAYEKLRELEYRADDGETQFPITVADTVLSSSDDLYNMRIECENLLTAAHTRPVTAEEYKRISQLVHWRAEQRYFTCFANGLAEEEAGQEFAEL